MADRAGGITTNELLTWEIQFARSGLLDLETQRRLLLFVKRHLDPRGAVVVVPSERT